MVTEIETIDWLIESAQREFCRSSVNRRCKVMDWDVITGEHCIVMTLKTTSLENTGLLYLTDLNFKITLSPSGYVLKAICIDASGFARNMTNQIRQDGITFR